MLAQPFFMRKEVVSKRWHNLFLLQYHAAYAAGNEFPD